MSKGREYYLDLLDRKATRGRNTLRCQCRSECDFRLWEGTPIVVSRGKIYSFSCALERNILSRSELVSESLRKDQEVVRKSGFEGGA